MHSNISSHFDSHNVLNNAQHGFRKKRSCISQLIITLNDFADCLKSKQQIDAILLDFSKAFDKVDHEGLILKLEHLGVRDSLLAWIRSFLIGRNQKVLVDGVSSDPKPVLSGVPQGTVLGPLLFLVYINDISDGLSKGSQINLFADDGLLYRTINNIKDSEALQTDLNLLQKWEKEWKMEFHPQKCQLLRVSNKQNKILYNYKIHNIPIIETSSAKYLGVLIDSNLSWKSQYNYVNKKANHVLSLLKRNFHFCSTSVKSKCYTTLIRPIVDYGCEVWDPHFQTDIDFIEKIQKRAARFATNNYCMKSGNSSKNLSSLNWDTLENRRSKIKLTTFQNARLENIYIPLSHLKHNSSRTRAGGNGLTYSREFSPVDGHIYSFFPSVTRLWNQLPTEVKSCNDVDSFKININNIDIASLKSKAYPHKY